MTQSPSRRVFTQWAVALPAGFFFLPEALAEDVKALKVYLQPMGRKVAAEDVRLAKDALVGMYGIQVIELPSVALPKDAYYKPRRRYRADKLLDFLDARAPNDAFRVLGLTGNDISTTKGEHKDWGVLGLASLNGVSGVISMFRCRRGARTLLQARERFAKVAVHEIGHTLGLEHCPTRGCLMEDAAGRVDTCDREYDLCHKCRRALATAGHRVPAEATLHWKRPRQE